MTKFSVKIEELKVIPKDEKLDLSNVVYAFAYSVIGEDGELSHSVYKEIGVGEPNAASFTPLEELNDEKVMSFLMSSLAADDMRCAEYEIQQVIDRMKNPVQAAVSIQWPLNK
jgi:hypothetical protein